MHHYLSLFPITDANIKTFKYNKTSSEQYQFTPVYQKLTDLHFFFFFFCWPVIAGDKKNCILFWPCVPCNKRQNFPRVKKTISEYQITYVYQKSWYLHVLLDSFYWWRKNRTGTPSQTGKLTLQVGAPPKKLDFIL